MIGLFHNASPIDFQSAIVKQFLNDNHTDSRREEYAYHNDDPPEPLGVVPRENRSQYWTKTCDDPDRGCQP